jgi:hypothetical protein
METYEQWLKLLEELSTENGVLEYFSQTTKIHRSVFDEGISASALVEYWAKL